ncbi:GAF domain-containing sensor histidine kinase [Nostocoides sp. HKS02]|uniref:GAF domain-containing sensor histidine kinase n=1 Tax=Nostocoides sp. HKS02 TaxID=1813880 RepID=UPI0018A87F14|nr:GAF domain-containing sensor histidine kinase [Tetrasphaera sp. HKS02]
MGGIRQIGRVMVAGNQASGTAPVELLPEMSALRRLSQLMNHASGQQSLQDLLDLIVDGAAGVVGFQVAAISLVQADGDLEVVAVAGDPDATAQLIGRRTPRHSVEAEFAVAEHWGSLRFVPADRLPTSAAEGWVAREWDGRGAADDPDAWDPEDTLLAPFYEPGGQMLGILSVDLPLDGRRPSQVQQGVLEVFANQAGIAINGARQRQALAEQVRLVGAVQTVARISQQVLEPARVLDEIVVPVLEGFACTGLWVRAFARDEDPFDEDVAAYSMPVHGPPPAALVRLARRMGEFCWQRQVPGLVRAGLVEPAGLLTAEEAAELIDFTGRTGDESLLLAPIGAGRECLGHLVLTRAVGARAWSDAEAIAALELGRDLGRAIVNARLMELERRASAELRESSKAKTVLFSTVSHELKNPLASIVGHLELLRDEPDGDLTWSIGVMERNTRRLQTLVDDLLTISRVSDPDRPLDLTARVDLLAVVQDTVDMFQPGAVQQGVSLSVQVGEGALVVSGSAEELGRVVQNLVSNAVKFTPPGGTVTLGVARRGGAVELVCADDGLGISLADQESLFSEFFRSTNPAALEVPGTGLGLSIVRRILDRHEGIITWESGLGRGTTFTVVLPAAG